MVTVTVTEGYKFCMIFESVVFGFRKQSLFASFIADI